MARWVQPTLNASGFSYRVSVGTASGADGLAEVEAIRLRRPPRQPSAVLSATPTRPKNLLHVDDMRNS